MAGLRNINLAVRFFLELAALAAFGYWGVGFPTGYVLAFHAGLGARGLWWGLAAGLASVALLMTLRFHRMTRVAPPRQPTTQG